MYNNKGNSGAGLYEYIMKKDANFNMVKQRKSPGRLF